MPETTFEEREEQYQEDMRKRREARKAQTSAWREEREQRHRKRMEKWLLEQEERQQRAIERHEAMRNKAEDEHNYLVQHYEEMVKKNLQEKIDVANRHEEMRKQADERRKKIATFRARLDSMTPAERREFMEQNRGELFARDDRPEPPAMPAAPPRIADTYRRPMPPPWYRMEPPAPQTR
jgi:colicin import membrane protein